MGKEDVILAWYKAGEELEKSRGSVASTYDAEAQRELYVLREQCRRLLHKIIEENRREGVIT